MPESASAIYGVRGICDFFKRDAVYGRFELLDDPDVVDYTNQASINRTAARGGHFGLVAMTEGTVGRSTPDTWRKKPEFYATSRLLRLLSDIGPAFAAEPLKMSVTGGGHDLQQLVLQKRDGRHYLVLWRDVQVCEPYPHARPIDVPPVHLDITLDVARPIAVYAPNAGGAPVKVLSRRRQFGVKVAGRLKVVEIG